jgi:hypothetical protein
MGYGELAVSNADGDDFNLTDLQLPDDELLAEEPVADTIQPAPEAEAGAQELESVELAEGEPQEEAAAVEEVEEEAEKKPEKKLPEYAELAGAIGIGVVLLAIGVVGLIYISTAVFTIAVGAVFYTIWRNRATSSIYTVLLGCALAAVLLSLYFLWIEIGRYQFDIRARSARPGVSLVLPLESSRPITA